MSKQDVSAVVEQDSSPVVENPVADSAVVGSAEGAAAEGGLAEVESADVASADVDIPKPVATADNESQDSATDATVEDATARPTRKSTKASALVREGEVAADFLEQLLDIADLDGDIDVDVDGDRAAVAIVDSEEGRVSRRLVGPDGKVLEALQELTRLAVQAATGERSRLMLDVAGHRAERRAALVTLAQGVIATVKATGEKQSMQPMTAFERKVVHDAVLASGLGSESEGAEPHRFVVILPA
jgi:spoIIIJ-associated protein